MIENAILEKNIELPIEVANPDLLHKLRLKRKIKTFQIKPVTIGALQQMAPYIKKINDPSKITEASDYVQYLTNSVVDDVSDFCMVIALAINNRKFSKCKLISFFQNLYIKSLTKYFIKNLSATEIFQVVSVINRQIGYKQYLAAMALLKNLDLNPSKAKTEAKK